MLQLGNVKFELSLAEMFNSDKEWIHREAIKDTYEIICVTKGTVYMCENDKHYELRKGDVLILSPNVMHKGYKISEPPVSFYWIHFYMDSEEYLKSPQLIQNFKNTSLFKEFIHYNCSPEYPLYAKESVFSRIFTEITVNNSERPAIIGNLTEWVRLNAGADLSVKKTAEYFGYNSAHLSRICKKYCNCTLKELISENILLKAKDYLTNSNYSIKEIASMLNFTSSGAFINYFKYYENTTPSKFRNTFYNTLLNNK